MALARGEADGLLTGPEFQTGPSEPRAELADADLLDVAIELGAADGLFLPEDADPPLPPGPIKDIPRSGLRTPHSAD